MPADGEYPSTSPSPASSSDGGGSDRRQSAWTTMSVREEESWQCDCKKAEKSRLDASAEDSFRSGALFCGYKRERYARVRGSLSTEESPYPDERSSSSERPFVGKGDLFQLLLLLLHRPVCCEGLQSHQRTLLQRGQKGGREHVCLRARHSQQLSSSRHAMQRL